MALPYKFNFRATDTFVTDAAGETYIKSVTNTNGGAGEVYAAPLRDGINCGWGAGREPGTRNRSTSAPIQMAGVHFNEGFNDATLTRSWSTRPCPQGSYS